MSAPFHTFTYDAFSIDAASDTLTCHYRLDDWTFTETVRLPGGGDWSSPAAREAARWVFLLAGVSYYKAGAPPVVDLGEHAVTDTERAFLREYYIDGLGEFAYRAEPRLDLTTLKIRGPALQRKSPAGYHPRPGTPLIPFGGGVDSIVTVELLRERGILGDTTPNAPSNAAGGPAAATAGVTAQAAPGSAAQPVPQPTPALFVVNRPDDRFEAIEQPAAVTGLPIVRAERTLDPQILRSAELGFLNGHVPVTGVISAIAVLAAVIENRDAVVMSNEWSASIGTVELDGRSINHQYSKSLAFETGFRTVLRESIGDGIEYFSLLRPFTELRIAQLFSQLPQYFDTFRSCNRAFYVDPAKRYDHWCGQCDKCAFIDLILAPFLDAGTLRQVFAGAGREPLDDGAMLAPFAMLVGLIPDAKPWECVGDIHESQVALHLAAVREDRQRTHLVQHLAERVWAEAVERGADPDAEAERLLHPVGAHHIPARYLPDEVPHI